MTSRLSVLHGNALATTDDDETGAPLEATVATTPSDLTDDVYVTVADFDTHRKIGPVLGWRTAPEASWPVRGDVALVVQAPQGNYWFIGWEPS